MHSWLYVSNDANILFLIYWSIIKLPSGDIIIFHRPQPFPVIQLNNLNWTHSRSSGLVNKMICHYVAD